MYIDLWKGVCAFPMGFLTPTSLACSALPLLFATLRGTLQPFLKMRFAKVRRKPAALAKEVTILRKRGGPVSHDGMRIRGAVGESLLLLQKAQGGARFGRAEWVLRLIFGEEPAIEFGRFIQTPLAV